MYDFIKKVNKNPFWTTVIGGLTVAFLSYFFQNKFNFIIVSSFLNFKIPIWFLLILIITFKVFNKFKLQPNNIVEKPNSNIEFKVDSQDIIETLNINKNILSYTEDEFEGILFKWEYKVTSSGYKIVNIHPICEFCHSPLTIDTIYDDDGNLGNQLICIDCFYKNDEDGNTYANQDACKVYNSDTYDSILNSIRPKIQAHIAVLKTQTSIINKNQE